MSVVPFTTIDRRDLDLLIMAISALEPDEAVDEMLWLQSFDGVRRWVVESPNGVCTFDVDDDATDAVGVGFVPISERICRFFSTLEVESVDLEIADGTTVVARFGVVSAAIDSAGRDADPPSMPTIASAAEVVVPARAFIDLLTAARSAPYGARDRGLVPPLWLHIDADMVALHVDWGDIGLGKSTYRLPHLHHAGDATVAIPHASLIEVLRRAPRTTDLDDMTFTLRIGTVDGRSALVVDDAEWSVLLWLFDPLEVRWASVINGAIDRAHRHEVVEQGGAQWVVTTPDHTVRIALHHGHPDIARVSAPLLTNVVDTAELLRELTVLNGAATGVRFWHGDDVVWAACDLPAFAIDGMLEYTVDLVAKAAAQYQPMLAALAESG